MRGPSHRSARRASVAGDEKPEVEVALAPKTRRELRMRTCARLEELERDGLLRTLEPPTGLDLCSNDYLGLARHPRMRRRLAQAVARLGVGSTGSRLLRGHRAAFRVVEERFAAIKGTEAALYFGSGWAANLGVLSAFPQEGDLIVSDELNHASLIDGMRLSKARRLVYPHCDMAVLRRILEIERCEGVRFVVTETLFSMDGDLAPLREIAQLQRQHDFELIVDEAHAVGIYGERGSGLVEELGCGDSVLMSINSAGKALGVSGAFACGPKWAVQQLIQSARPFVFSTAPPPALAEAISEALDILAEEPARRRRVRGHGRRFRDLAGLGAGDSPIVPVVLGSNRSALRSAARLRAEGYDVRAIRPPTVPEGTARLRVSLNADLEAREVEGAALCVRDQMETNK